MRILLVAHQYFPHHRGGVERSTRELALALSERGHDVQIAAGERGRMLSDASVDSSEAVDDIPVHRVYLNSRLPGSFLYGGGLDPQWNILLHRVQPDIVHVQHLQGLSLSLLHKTKSAGIPLILHFRDASFFCARHFLLRGDGRHCMHTDLAGDCLSCLADEPAPPLTDRIPAAVGMVAANIGDRRAWTLTGELIRRRLKRWPKAEPLPLHSLDDFSRRNAALVEALRVPDRLLAISAPLATRLNDLSASLGVRDVTIEPLLQAPDSTGIVRRDRALPTDRPLRVGVLGKWSPIKGLDVLLDAFAALPPDRIELHAWGSATKTNLRDMAYARRLRKRVQALPHVHLHAPDDDLCGVLDRMDVLAAPSICFEGYHRASAEALAAGIPVLCSDRGGFTEFVTHDHNGLHVPLGDAPAWTAALNRLLTEPDLIARLSQHANEPKHFPEYVEQVLAVYQSLVDPNK